MWCALDYIKESKGCVNKKRFTGAFTLKAVTAIMRHGSCIAHLDLLYRLVHQNYLFIPIFGRCFRLLCICYLYSGAVFRNEMLCMWYPQARRSKYLSVCLSVCLSFCLSASVYFPCLYRMPVRANRREQDDERWRPWETRSSLSPGTVQHIKWLLIALCITAMSSSSQSMYSNININWFAHVVPAQQKAAIDCYSRCIDWFIGSFIHSFMHWMVDSLVYWFIGLLIH